MKKALFLLPFLLVMITVPLFKYWNMNYFSLNTLWLNLAGNSFGKGIQLQVPEAHKRGRIWLAQSDLSTNKANVQSILDSLSSSNDPLARRMVAKILYARGDIDGAIRIWKQIRDLNSLLSLGYELVGQGDYDTAQKAYTAAQAIGPEKASDRLVSLLLWNKNSPREAEIQIRRILTVYPQSSYRLNWLRYLADSLRLQRRFDEAIAGYRQVIAENPQDWAAYSGLGWSCYERGDGFQAAMDYFNKAVLLNQSTGDADFAVAEVLVKEKRYTEADVWYARAIDRSPENNWLYVARANALSSSGNLARAAEVYQETAERFPSFVPNYCYSAWNDRLMDHKNEAVKTIEKASAIAGEKGVPSWCSLIAGWIYEWAGEKERAIQSFEKVLAVEPGNSQALDGINRLKK